MSEAAAQPTTETPAATPPVVDPATPPGALLGTEPVVEAPKPAEPAAPVVPEKYEFTPPEVDGKPAAFDAEALTAFEATARELGLTQEQFQGVSKAGIERIQALASKPYEAWHTQQRTWQDEIKADPELGGDKLPANLALAAKALDAFGGAPLRQALETTGAGNNPAIVRAFVAMGKALGDSDGLSTGKPAGAAAPRTQEQAARQFYGPTVYPDA